MASSFYQKENVTLTFRLRDQYKDPWDLTGKVIIARFLKNGSLTNKSCAISGDGLIGKCVLELTDEETALLGVGNLQIDLYVGDYASPPTITPASDVTDKIFIFEVEVKEVQ